jgi:septum formation protein
MPSLVLASASPRRAELLTEAGYTFTIHAADLDEERLGRGVEPRDLALHLATAKAEHVAKTLEGGAVVLAADTIARTGDGSVLGKPINRDDARRILTQLVNTRHGVITGYCLIRVADGERRYGQVRSDVVMRAVSDDELERFLDTNLWQGKAGAYGIQDEPGVDEGDLFVEQIDGELSNVIGLPMPQVVEALEELGVERQ